MDQVGVITTTGGKRPTAVDGGAELGVTDPPRGPG
jgi:hypothetical protein